MPTARLTGPSTAAPVFTGIRRGLRLVMIEVRFSYAWLFMPLVVIASIWFFNAWLWQPARHWSVISSNIAQSFLLIGPAAAMWSSYVAGREGRSRLQDLTASMPVQSLPRHLLVVGTPVIGSVLAYGVGALVNVWWYGREMTWGGPDLTLIGFGAVVVFTCAMVGAAAGQIVPGRFAPVIVSGSLFIYFVMSYSISDAGGSVRGWAMLAYPRDVSFFGSPLVYAREGLSANEPPLLAGFLICGAVIALATALLVGSHGRWIPALPFLLLAVAGIISALPMTTITDAEQEEAIAAMEERPMPVENPSLVCAGDIVTTCLHQIDQRDLDDVSTAVDAFVAPVVGLAGVPDRIEMRADLHSEGGVLRFSMAGFQITPDRLISMIIPSIFDEHATSDGMTKSEQVILAWMLAPVESISVEDIRFIAPPGVMTGDVAPDVMAEWRAEVKHEAERFGSLPVDQKRAWLEANWDALRAGEVTMEDLP